MKMQITILAALLAILIVIPQNAQGQYAIQDAQAVQYPYLYGPAYPLDAENGYGAIAQDQYAYPDPNADVMLPPYTADQNGYQVYPGIV